MAYDSSWCGMLLVFKLLYVNHFIMLDLYVVFNFAALLLYNSYLCSECWRSADYHTFPDIHKSYRKARCFRGSPQSDRHADPQMLRILRNVPSYKLSPVLRESHPVKKSIQQLSTTKFILTWTQQLLITHLLASDMRLTIHEESAYYTIWTGMQLVL